MGGPGAAWPLLWTSLVLAEDELKVADIVQQLLLLPLKVALRGPFRVSYASPGACCEISVDRNPFLWPLGVQKEEKDFFFFGFLLWSVSSFTQTKNRPNVRAC